MEESTTIINEEDNYNKIMRYIITIHKNKNKYVFVSEYQENLKLKILKVLNNTLSNCYLLSNLDSSYLKVIGSSTIFTYDNKNQIFSINLDETDDDFLKEVIIALINLSVRNLIKPYKTLKKYEDLLLFFFKC